MAALLAVGLHAQTHRVAKPQTVTRAVGVYEWTGDLDKPTASRLVPVSLFIDGRLEDAGVYLARPVPFALSPGFVYAVEKAGEPLGTVDLSEARNMVAQHGAEDDSPLSAWFGFGRYIPPPAAPKAPALHTTAHPGTIVATGGSSTDGRPHLSDRTGDEGASSKDKASASASTSASRDGDASKSADKQASTDDSDRPHMSRRSDTPESSTGTDSSPSPAKGGSASADDDPERPTLRRRDTKSESKRRKESGSGVRPLATSLNDDPDRPTLHRGSEDTPGATPPLNGNPPGLHQAVAVSDATTTDNHLFARAWESSAERASTMAAFETLARPRVVNYLATNQLRPGTAATVLQRPTGAPGTAPSRGTTVSAAPPEDTGAPPRLQRGRPAQGVTIAPQTTAPQTAPAPQAALAPQVAPAPKPAARTRTPVRRTTHGSKTHNEPPLLLANEQLSGFLLSYGGVPTFVYSADTPTAEGTLVHITLIAQQLPSGEFQIALSSLTDDNHLDRTPWTRLVDVVDPNNSHRASFLFELRAKQSRQFALYSLVSAQAEQSFVTGLMQ